MCLVSCKTCAVACIAVGNQSNALYCLFIYADVWAAGNTVLLGRVQVNVLLIAVTFAVDFFVQAVAL
jgi:hypothetical protein